MGEHKLKLPLMAARHFPHYEVLTPLQILDILVKDRWSTIKVEIFNNDYELDGHITMLCKEDSRIVLDKHKLTIKPRESALVNLEFEGQDLGPYRELIEVNTEGAYEAQYLIAQCTNIDQKANFACRQKQLWRYS